MKKSRRTLARDPLFGPKRGQVEADDKESSINSTLNAIDLSTQTNFELQEFCINQTFRRENVIISILISAAQHLSIFEKESFLNEFCFVI